MFEKRASTQVQIADVLALRWSGRAYDPERPVERAKLTALLEAARWAPSCFGDQPWRYLIWDRIAESESWSRAFDCLSEGNKNWAVHAPVLMLAVASDLFSDGRPNRWGQYDTGAASMSLAVQATALGLMVHQMGGFDAKKIQAEFAIPDGYACMAMITVGYQIAEDKIPNELKEREYATRMRRPLSHAFFFGTWGKPFE
ncbi:nitroreductase family protein [Methylocaldum sp. MU1018]